MADENVTLLKIDTDAAGAVAGMREAAAAHQAMVAEVSAAQPAELQLMDEGQAQAAAEAVQEVADAVVEAQTAGGEPIRLVDAGEARDGADAVRYLVTAQEEQAAAAAAAAAEQEALNTTLTGMEAAAPAEQAQALQDLAAAENQAAAAADGAAGGGRGGLRGLTSALRLVSPEAAEAVREFRHLRDAAAFLENPANLAIGGYIAGLAAVAVAVKAVYDYVQQTNQAFQEFLDSQEKIRDAASKRQTEVAKAAAAVGLTPEAATKARGLADRMSEIGIDRGAAVQAAVAGVDQSGEQVLSDDQLLRLAAGQETGMVKGEFKGRDESQRARSRDRLMREVERNQPAIDSAVVTLLDDVARIKDNLARAMDATGLAARVKEAAPNLDEAGVAARVQLIKDQAAAYDPAKANFQEGVPSSFRGATGAATKQTIQWDPILAQAIHESAVQDRAAQHAREAMSNFKPGGTGGTTVIQNQTIIQQQVNNSGGRHTWGNVKPKSVRRASTAGV